MRTHRGANVHFAARRLTQVVNRDMQVFMGECEQMTPNVCNALCMGFAFFGLQNGNSCSCAADTGERAFLTTKSAATRSHCGSLALTAHPHSPCASHSHCAPLTRTASLSLSLHHCHCHCVSHTASLSLSLSLPLRLSH